MSQVDEKQQPQETPSTEQRANGPERVFIVPYPKVIFLYPTAIAALIAAVWLSLLGDQAINPEAPVPVALCASFLVGQRHFAR